MASSVKSRFVQQVGANIRGRRRDQGLTVQQLSDACGISRRMLTQIELGQANPSLITLDKIARALETDFAGLTRATTDDALVVTRAASATEVWSTTDGGRALLHVSAHERGGPELWTWRLEPGELYKALPDAPGSEELFLVIEGRLTVETNDVGAAELGPGDAARLASDREYAYVNHGNEACRFIRVVRVR